MTFRPQFRPQLGLGGVIAALFLVSVIGFAITFAIVWALFAVGNMLYPPLWDPTLGEIALVSAMVMGVRALIK
jgi:hypothetical protein